MGESTEYVLEITFADDPALRERVEGALYLSDSAGSVARETGDGVVVISAWFVDRDARTKAMADLSSMDGIAIDVSDREPVDWLDLYEQSLEPIEVGRRFVIAPDARLLQDVTGRIPLIVPQERAFGTGSHPTTSMCIELMEDLAGDRDRAVDIGTGSGILAIAMKKLGCRSVFAFDNDPETLGVVRDNLRRNGMDVTEVLHFISAVEALQGGRFDLVTMNIIPEVIIPLLPRVTELLAEDAILILSGILEERARDVVGAAGEQGLTLESERGNGEWWAGRFVR